MSQKPFDHIENKIKEVSEHYEPALDEGAWNKMEALLDQDKNRRRPFAWFWFAVPVLLLTGITGYLFLHTDISPVQIVQHPTQKQKSIIIENIPPVITNNKLVIAGMPAAKQTTIDPVNYINRISRQKLSVKITTPEENIEEKILANERKENNEIQNYYTEKVDNVSNKEDIVITTKDDKENDLVVIEEKEKNITRDTLDQTSKNVTGNNEISKPSRFYFTGVAGLDAGSVKLLSFNNSKVVVRYGVGVGYQLSKKISIQAGFYAGHKKYIAGPGDYKPKAGSYFSTVDIDKVDADCMIYEIPLSVRYNIKSSARNIFYTTAGLTSFIMKNEDYNYYYRYNNNPYHAWRAYTGNKNLFSVLTFSAGMERKLSSSFSLLAEPYIGIPLAGVGEGGVKLYTAGMQVGVKYQPK